MVKTYIINLITSADRLKYMLNLLRPYSQFNIEVIEAVDGRVFSSYERAHKFDDEVCYSRYGRLINGGEIGCTLSHFKCYEKVACTDEKYVLILEDDISIIRDLNLLNINEVENLMSGDAPVILFLSGDYWHLDNRTYTRVFNAVGSYAYFINKPAVSRILTMIDKPSHVADDWDVYKQLGVKLYAVHPYMIDANIEDIPSDIQQEYWGNHKNKMKCKYLLRAYYNGLVKRVLGRLNLFESKRR